MPNVSHTFLRTGLRALVAILLAACSMQQHATASGAYQGAALASQARVDLAHARAAALDARPGEITDQELEREPGGSGLRYSFDIRSDGVTYEVGIDAQSGAVLENAPEGQNPD